MQQFQLFLLLLPPHFTDTEPIPLCLAFLWKAAITFCCWLLPKCRSRILTAPPPPRMEKGPNAHQIWLDPSRVDVEEQSLLLRTPPLSRNSPPLSPLDCLKFSLHFQSITAVRGRKLHRSSTDPWLFFKIPSFRPPPLPVYLNSHNRRFAISRIWFAVSRRWFAVSRRWFCLLRGWLNTPKICCGELHHCLPSLEEKRKQFPSLVRQISPLAVDSPPSPFDQNRRPLCRSVGEREERRS